MWYVNAMALALIIVLWFMLDVALHSLLEDVWWAGFAVGACVGVVYEAECQCYERALKRKDVEALHMRMQVIELKVAVRELAKQNTDARLFMSRFRLTTAGSAKF